MTAGETWTREVLYELRAGGFAPDAWMRFLGRSFARARERRAERQREHRSVVLLAAAGGVAWLSAAAAGRPWLALAGACWWLLQAAMLDWHLGMLERPDGSPLERLGLANLLTLARGGLPPALLLLAGSQTGLALLLAAGAADVADGRLARRLNEQTLLGVWLDGSVDTLVVGAAALGAMLHGLLPAWAALPVLVRVGLPWVLAAGAYFGRAQRPAFEGIAVGRRVSLAAGMILLAGLALAFLHLPVAAPVAVSGAAGGLGALAVAARHTLATAS